MADPFSVVMMGATGAVGSEVVKQLLLNDSLQRLTLLGRNCDDDLDDERVSQHVVDVEDKSTFQAFVEGHQIAICTLGIGQPSKVSRKVFEAIDKKAPLEFARLCRKAGVRHFSLLSSVGAHAKSSSFYLRSKGELEHSLRHMGFDRVSLFHPSMLLTKTNRYGAMQGLILKYWPKLDPLLVGPFQKMRGIPVETLGAAIANNIQAKGKSFEILEWRHFQKLAKR